MADDDATPARWERFTTEALRWIADEAEKDSLPVLAADVRVELSRRDYHAGGLSTIDGLGG
jgi:hypothetical protein